jgi:hypothetical protein
MARFILPRSRLAFLCALLGAIFAATPAPAQKAKPRPALPVEQWLRGPDRQDFPWKVQLLPARLTFQQRYLVQLRATIPAAVLQKGAPERDLYFVVKAADERGRWFDGESYNHYPVPPSLSSQTDVEFDLGLYTRPGDYQIAVMVYDRVLRQGNLWRGPLHVPSLKDDPLPQLERDLPAIEFLPDVPRESLFREAPRQRFRTRRWDQWQPKDDRDSTALWPLGHGREWLPLSGTRPLRIDVLLNFSQVVDPGMQFQPSPSVHQEDVGQVLQIGSLLSHLGVASGCVRITGLDIVRRHVIFERQDGRELNWDKVRDTVAKLDQTTVDVRSLEDRTRGGSFLRDHLARLMADAPACGSGRELPQRVVVVVSRELSFPGGAKLEPPAAKGCCRFFYLQTRGHELYEGIWNLLKPVKARRFTVSDPLRFRKALAGMMADIEAARRLPE